MYNNFLKLDKEKRDKIINASLTVFSKSTYGKASTDDIVKEAGISKGSLFHYFKSKRDLYIFLYDYTADTLIKEIYEKINRSEKDIFAQYKNIFIIKLELFKKYPNMISFLIKATIDKDLDLKEEIFRKNNNANLDNFNIVFGDLDRGMFREDIDVDTAIEMIRLTFEGYSYTEISKLSFYEISDEMFDKWLKDIDRFIETMKKIYYKGDNV